MLLAEQDILKLLAFHFAILLSELFASGLSHYDVSVPVRVSRDGDFLSHSVHHVRPASNRRRRRHVTADDVTDDNGETLHYKLRVNGSELHLELTPNHGLLAPGFVVQRRPRGYKGIQHSNITSYPETACHFQGHVRGHPGSKVALATCHGLVSLEDRFCP